MIEMSWRRGLGLFVLVVALVALPAVMAGGDFQLFIPIAMSAPDAPPPPPPPGVTVLPNHSTYVSSSTGTLFVVGEVQNSTATPIWLVKASVNFFDASDHLVATAFGYVSLPALPAREKSCFDIILLDPPTDWTRYEFEPVDYDEWNDPLPTLALFDDSGGYDTTFGWYEIIGQVRNDGPTLVESTLIVATLYNDAAQVRDCAFSYANTTDLAPGQASAFDIINSSGEPQDVTSYRLQADGNPK